MIVKRFVTTEIGLEKKCGRCGEYWPADGEFWYSEGTRGLSKWCKACYEEWRKERRKRKEENAQSQTATA